MLIAFVRYTQSVLLRPPTGKNGETDVGDWETCEISLFCFWLYQLHIVSLKGDGREGSYSLRNLYMREWVDVSAASAFNYRLVWREASLSVAENMSENFEMTWSILSLFLSVSFFVILTSKKICHHVWECEAILIFVCLFVCQIGTKPQICMILNWLHHILVSISSSLRYELRVYIERERQS